MSEQTSPLQEVKEDEARAWAKAEDVAIHFNELIMNFRLKAVGAITLAAGLVGTVLVNRSGEAVPRANYIAFALGMWFLAVVWLAILCLDLGYYHRLLLGAVDEVLRLEAASGGRLQLSTRIKKKTERADSLARSAFYVLPLVAMITAGVVAWHFAPAQEPASGVGWRAALGQYTQLRCDRSAC